jgi:hypothetical protein
LGYEVIFIAGTFTMDQARCGYNVYRCVRKNKSMEPITVGIREFRENLAEYLLESNAPVAITRHGDTIGFYTRPAQAF